MLLAALLPLAAANAADQRRIPADARSGRLTVTAWPQVTVDRKPLRLAPGARILNLNNATVTPNAVPPDSPVRYQLDAGGQIRMVWLMPAADRDGQVKALPATGVRQPN
jgi:hypothetical protein